MHLNDRVVALDLLALLLFLLGRFVLGLRFFFLGILDLVAHGAGGLAADLFGQLGLAVGAQQFFGGFVREDQQHGIADRRHVGLHLFAHLGIVHLQGDADL